MKLCVQIAFVVSALMLPVELRAQERPQPPCGSSSSPAYAATGVQPNVGVWRRSDSNDGDWSFPACSRWRTGTFKVLVALAGSFRHSGTADELLSRFGRISELTSIRYWSVSDKEWRPLIEEAAALLRREANERRPDFGVAELKDRREQYFLQTDSRLSVPVIYRMRILEFRTDRIVVETENVTAVRIAGVTVIQPGEIRAVYFLERISPGVWGYYGLALSGQDLSGLLR